MQLRLRHALYSCLIIGGCAATPMGSPSLASRPSPHLEARPYELIAKNLRSSVVHAPCGAAATRIGPAANLDASLIPSDQYVQEGRRAQALIEPYRFNVMLSDGDLKGSMLQVIVPAGFVSDFHSMPDQAVGVTLSMRRALEAAVVHDWLYAVGRPGDDQQKALADQIYADILAHYGVEGLTHWAVSSTVRMGGKKSFGAPVELRFYNKCFYGLCPDRPLPELAVSPATPLRPDQDLRDRLWGLTVCISHSALADAR